MKTGLVDVGGGQRGVYAAGVMDRFLEDGLCFDLGIGVSAGSANIASLIAGQKGRNYHFYVNYSQREEYMSRKNMRAKGCLLDVEYIYGTLSSSDGEDPLNFDAYLRSPTDFLAVGTDAETGEARYFRKLDMRQDDYHVLMASSAVPYVCKPQPVDGRLYYDGALSDPAPVKKAFELGCDRVVLILTRPVTELRRAEDDEPMAARIEKQFPAAAEALRNRARLYNEGVAWAGEQERLGRVKIIAPEDCFGVDTLTTDKAALHRLYQKGLADGAVGKEFLA